MPIPVPQISQVTDKWQRRASVAGEDYARGIDNPARAWDEAAAAGDANYRQAVTAAAAAGRYQAGVRAAGAAKWQRGAKEKGVARFPEGVRVGSPDYQAKMQQVLTTIGGVTLPARGPRGSAANYARVQPIGDALRRAFGKAGTAR